MSLFERMKYMKIYKVETNIENIKLNVLFKVASLNKNKGTNSPLHRHMHYEVHYINSGDVLFEFENTSKRTQDKTLVIIAPEVYHTVKFLSEEAEHVAFELRLSKLNTGKDLYSDYNLLFNKIKKYVFLPYSKNDFLDFKESIPSSLNTEGEYISKAKLTLLFFELTKTINKKFNIDKVQSDNFIEENSVDEEIIDVKIMKYIETHYSEPITISDLAATLYISPRHTERVIKKIFSKTFTDLLQEYRIAIAKYKIKNELNSSLEDIGRSVGFDSYSSFWKYFKRITNVTPKEYRNRKIKKS